MYCPECGAQNNDGSKFCCNCAKPLIATAYSDAKKKESSKKLASANLLNIIAAVILVLSLILIEYGISTSTGGVSSNTSVNGNITSSSSTSIEFDTSGASNAYTAIVIGAVVAALGFVLYFGKNNNKKTLAYIYMGGALIATCFQFFGGVRTISFTCGLGFIMMASGILQIVAGSKFISAVKDA